MVAKANKGAGSDSVGEAGRPPTTIAPRRSRGPTAVHPVGPTVVVVLADKGNASQIVRDLIAGGATVAGRPELPAVVPAAGLKPSSMPAGAVTRLWPDKDLEELEKLARDGPFVEDLAAHFGRSPKAVETKLYHLRIKPRWKEERSVVIGRSR
jgi:hypothetical protein